jgi:hypothetical protein
MAARMEALSRAGGALRQLLYARLITPASPASVANASVVPAASQASAEIGSPAGRRAAHV